MVSKRIDFIDIAKGIGILIVICSHSNNHELMRFANAFFMPLFFILSGYTYIYNDKINLFQSITKKARRLLIPYLFSNIVLLSFLTLLGESSYINIIGIIYSRFFIFQQGKALLHWWCSPTWFLTALFMAYVIVFLTKGKKKIEIICIPIFILITFVLNHLPILLPWSLDTAFLFASYILTGVLIKRYHIVYNIGKYLLPIFISYIVIIYYNGHINYSIRVLGYNIVLTFIAGLLGSLLVIWFSKIIESTKLSMPLVALGKNSLLIFCFHIPIITTFNAIIEQSLFAGNKPLIYFIAICSVVLTAIIGYYFAKVLYHFFPFLK